MEWEAKGSGGGRSLGMKEAPGGPVLRAHLHK